jgi:hypothetical protein
MILTKVGKTKNRNGKLTIFPVCDCCGNMEDNMYGANHGKDSIFLRLCSSCLWILGSLINTQFKMDLP